MSEKFKNVDIHEVYAKDGRRSTSAWAKQVFGWRGKDTREIHRSARLITVSAGEISRFLGCRMDEVYLRRAWVGRGTEVDVEGFDRFLARDCEVAAKFGRSRATYRFLCRGPDKDATVIDGMLFVRHMKTRLVFGIGPLDPCYYGDSTTVFDLLAAEKDKAVVDGLVERFFSEKTLKNKTHKVSREGDIRRVEVTATVRLDDVVLPPEAKEAILANTVGLLAKREVYRKNGIPLKRGILLEGPPGNGKTMACKALARTGMFTTFWVTPSEYRDLFPVYEKAAGQAPSIVLFEDIDLLGATRNEAPRALGELLNIMDGLVEADGVITIATTNHADVLDAALAQRPNRFDLRVSFPNPDRSLRLEMLRKFTATQGDPGEARWDEWAGRTQGMSAAQLRELCYLAIRGAIEAGRLDAEGRAVIEDRDLEDALATVTGSFQPKRQVGFAP